MAEHMIRWVHLSDLHIGSKHCKWLDPTIRSYLVTFLKTCGEINFIVISGDIIHQGKYNDKDNVDKAIQLIGELKSCCNNIVFCLGNHDYNRNDSRYLLLKQWQLISNTERIDNERDYSEKLGVDFNYFVELIKKEIDPENPICSGSYVYKKIQGLNVVVLNTSIFSGQPVLNSTGDIVYKDGQPQIKDDGKLWVSESSLPSIEELDYTLPTIVVGHHAFKMFDSTSKSRLIQFMKNLPSKYFFCGHIHETEAKEIDGIKQIACAGLFKDSYNNPSFSVHEINKNQNEHITTKHFVYNSGKWEEHNLNTTSSETNTIEKSVEKEKTVYVREPSEVSDGAIRLPYNDGVFNIYTSKADATDIITPHLHHDVDEVTYVTNGSIYAFVGNRCSLLHSGNALQLPKGKLHAFIPNGYRCEYITMGVEKDNEVCYERNWNRDIDDIRSLDKQFQSREPQEALSIINKIVEYLKSSIMEVRWEAVNVLKKYAAQENDYSTYIDSQIQSMVIDTINKKECEEKIYGITMANEFRRKLSPQTLRKQFLNTDSVLYLWSCVYYLIKVRPNIDYETLYEKIHNPEIDSNEEEKICYYYKKIFVSLLQLILKHDGKIFSKVYADMHEKHVPDVMPIDDIIINLTVLYTSSKYSDENTDFGKALKAVESLEIIDAEETFRIMLNHNDIEERFNALNKSKEHGVLDKVVKAFFEATYVDKPKNISVQQTYDNIKSYLRIIVSEGCNLRCIYCHKEGRMESLIGSQIENNPDFDLRTVLIKAKELGFKKIKISGGEPLLYPNILEVCSEFQNDFDDIGFTTNGTQILKLEAQLRKIVGRKLTFNVTLNSCEPTKYEYITKGTDIKSVKEGIKLLTNLGYKVKLNSVITSYNLDDIEMLIAYAARMKIDVKLLDLFPVSPLPENVQHVSIAEIKSKLMELYGVCDNDFSLINDYMCMNALGIKVMIPKRVYSADCQLNCKMYPCAEGLFGIRVYEDYSCACCFKGEVYSGGINQLKDNIENIRRDLDAMRLCF